MKRNVSLGIRISEIEKERLDRLSETTLRSRAGVVRWLINKEYDRVFDPKGEKQPEAETDR